MNRVFPADRAGVGQGAALVRSYLDGKGIHGKENEKTTLVAEETMADLVSHASEGGRLSLTLRPFLETIVIEVRVPGEAYAFGERLVPQPDSTWADPDSSTEAAIRDRILAAYTNNAKYRHKNGVNTVRMTIHRQSRTLLMTLCALFAAIILGVILVSTGPAGWVTALNANLLSPVKTMYLNALKMIAGPVVFFSIATSISQLGSPSELGRIGVKILGLYMLTTVISVSIGIGVSVLFSPGNAAMASRATAAGAAVTSQAVSASLKDLIVGIVPDNILAPMLETNMLQLIFIAVLCGVAIGMIGDYSKSLRALIESCNELFMKITFIIMRTTPVVVFCSILSLIISIGVSSLVSLLGMMGTFLVGMLCMMAVYSVLMMIAGLNPIRFFKRYAPVMLQYFPIASSNAAIPLNMEFCRKELKISPKIYSFSIPLGATINMDGMCIILTVQSLTLAKVFGVAVPGNMLVTMALSIVFLSGGAPGVPGATIIMMSMLLELLGVPAEAITLIIGIGPLIGMFVCVNNCTGDVVVTTLVAKSEKLMGHAK